MNYDKKCKWHKSCGYDFCHGEGIYELIGKWRAKAKKNMHKILRKRNKMKLAKEIKEI